MLPKKIWLRYRQSDPLRGFMDLDRQKGLSSFSSWKLQNLSLGRYDLRLMICLLTDHCSVRYHVKNMRLVYYDTCQFYSDGKELAEHLLCKCKVFLSIDSVNSIGYLLVLNFRNADLMIRTGFIRNLSWIWDESYFSHVL